ncbi:acetyl/propionyl/methylcrotonyl-CoA carboxylase subunit alpha [Sporichthya polymorpha]|uniref:acetyl/propionyl/methylcrotonyl-CoA carboxylase subunit alpha n=1 Tax=Sporichthya polymorpha TaxID=35751 RepID=UPI00036B86D3|nr:biotin carboxylase N-terminal domain-containing protein [Sporichthya polymorpha]
MTIRPVRKLLVANRGEIAVHVLRTAHELGIATVAVHSDPDADAPFVALADEAVRLPGATPAETYLRGDSVIAAARATGADAVHPGYGFLSENAGFARDCQEAGLTFVGPAPAAIAAMGSKLEAKALMAAAGVPVLPGATVGPGEDARAEADRIGYPVLVKAAFGGGGRGMRVVRDPDELAGALEQAAREAASAFGDGTVFLERYVERPRHVEVQILGDAHGTVVSLFERDCSVQRRHQKIVEECPSPAVDAQLRADLGAAAVAAGRAIGYTNAGTVEFLLEESGAFHFLEVNARLQVEHPVTEMVTGLDLVALQIQVAEGRPLPESVRAARLDGHAIEARLYAEDVPAGFLPTTGTLDRFHVPTPPGVRVDSGVSDGSVVGPHYDAMLAKVVAHGETRDEAARRLARVLARAELHGVVTNRDLLVGLLGEEEFLAGRADTAYLDRHPELTNPQPAAATRVHAVVAALARQARNRSTALVLAGFPSGWRNAPAPPQAVSYAVGGRTYAVTYTIRDRGAFGRDVDVAVDGEDLPCRLVTAAPERVVLESGGVRRTYRVHTVGGRTYVDGPDGTAALVELPRLPEPGSVAAPGSLLAPMPGTVVRVLAATGESVTPGQVLVVLEAMKMEHTVTAPAAGTLSRLTVAPGDQVQPQQLIAVIEEQPPEYAA